MSVTTLPSRARAASATVLPILAAVSFSHLLNDLTQSLLPALYPILKSGFALSFAQIGIIALTFQLTASVLQPLVGQFTDKHPLPWSLPIGMGFNGTGLLLLGTANTFPGLLIGAAALGIGASIFHPESSRVARLASGGRYGFAQSFFQVGGNTGSSLGPLLAAFIVAPRGQHAIGWFVPVALLGMVVLSFVSRWYSRHLAKTGPRAAASTLYAPSQVRRAMVVLVILTFSKFVYLSSLGNYLTFYLMQRFHLPIQAAQLHLFAFLAAVAVGTFAGGPIGDRIGRKQVIWVSILGVLPFSLALPHVGLVATDALLITIGLVLSSAFSAILVYGQELMPGRVGMVSGLFFGLAFGLGGLAAAGLGLLIDHTSLGFVYTLCSVLPALGIFTVLLPKTPRQTALP